MVEADRAQLQTSFGGFSVVAGGDQRLLKLAVESYNLCLRFGKVAGGAAMNDGDRVAVLAVITALSPITTSTRPQDLQMLDIIYHLSQACGQITRPLG